MKLFISKGALLKGCLMIAATLIGLACEEDREITYDTSSPVNPVLETPFIQVVTSFIPFEVGTEEYEMEFNVINGTNALTSVKMIGSFFDAQSGLTTDEKVYGEYPVESPYRTVITESFTYEELSAGLTGGTPPPASDEDVFPGSGWAWRFEGVDAVGETVAVAGAINMVLSKYAGNYVVSESQYTRGTDDFGGWDDQIVFMGFVSQTTLSYNGRWGYFSWPGCGFNVEIDEAAGEVVEVPIVITADEGGCGLFGGVAPLNCTLNKNTFSFLNEDLGYVACDVSNVIIDNNATGEHVIKLTYGYMGANGIPRSFTETLTKIVD